MGVLTSRGRRLGLALGGALIVSVVIGAVWSAADRDESTVVIGRTTNPTNVIDGGPSPIGTNAVLDGERLPDAEVRNLDGAAVSTGDLVGTPLVINVWGSTCGPCKAELPAFAAAHAAYGDRVRFVGISYLPPSDREAAFATDRGIDYELYYDADGAFISAAGIAAFPVTLFVAPDGTIVEQTGVLDEQRLSDLLDGLIG